MRLRFLISWVLVRIYTASVCYITCLYAINVAYYHYCLELKYMYTWTLTDRHTYAHARELQSLILFVFYFIIVSLRCLYESCTECVQSLKSFYSIIIMLRCTISISFYFRLDDILMMWTHFDRILNRNWIKRILKYIWLEVKSSP